MPRQMPWFDLELNAQSKIANEIVLAGEYAAIRGGKVGVKWTRKRLEFLHELAYLRVFAAWESMLEAIFLRSLCGFASRGGQETLVSGKYHRTISAAEVAVLAGQQYVLWHNSAKIINRCKMHIQSGAPPPGAPPFPALQERTIASNQARLDAFAAIRHRIVHEQNDAKTKFHNATLLLAARTYPSCRPGEFLRDLDTRVAPPRKWLNTLSTELANLVAQMV